MTAWTLLLFVSLLVWSTGPASSQDADQVMQFLGCLKEKDDSARMARLQKVMARCPEKEKEARVKCIFTELNFNNQEAQCIRKLSKKTKQ
ncbi:unnamed protein product [Ixodes persulcatus]